MTVNDSTSRLAGRLDGLLFFPVTAFDGAGGVDLDAYRRHLSGRLAVTRPAAVFACCGTGEFFSLGLEEYERCVRAAVAEAAGRVPVVAGIGYGTALATQFATAAAAAGADGLLVMPPYLVEGSQAGLREHYRRLADAVDLELIVYQRDNAVFTPDTVAELAAHPRIVGFKDGRGDLDLMRRIVGAVRERHGEGALLYFNGMPTAEMTSQAYRAVGVPGYSSAVYCFAPDLAMAFYRAYRSGDEVTVDRLLDGFWRPYVELRRLGQGYAVSLVKAGVRLDGVDVGPVRAPLSEPEPEHVRRLAELIERGRELIR
ncbi:5-dehydro-4-deoxyglucarate dehydratase [Rugosimonospora acidiphila]|uniref:Probable 5-dehydro-4-deoxyglucarate dehydratase n=1 Tax=Rugosimonospora acidiphila TaxID=556531 RepID=A0ABP9SGR2_9ACTN